MQEIPITHAGLTRFTEELERLKTDGRREMGERIRQAVSTDADATANSDYLAAREEQERLEAKIARLEQRLAAARVMRPRSGGDRVGFGGQVRVRDVDTGTAHDYELVGPLESDPHTGRISNESPLGRALLGRRCGEIALVDTPRGQFRYEIVAVGMASAAA